MLHLLLVDVANDFPFSLYNMIKSVIFVFWKHRFIILFGFWVVSISTFVCFHSSGPNLSVKKISLHTLMLGFNVTEL